MKKTSSKKTIAIILVLIVVAFVCYKYNSLKAHSYICDAQTKRWSIKDLAYNPFHFCNKGDIITVTTMTDKDMGTLPVDEMGYFLITSHIKMA